MDQLCEGFAPPYAGEGATITLEARKRPSGEEASDNDGDNDGSEEHVAPCQVRFRGEELAKELLAADLWFFGLGRPVPLHPLLFERALQAEQYQGCKKLQLTNAGRLIHENSSVVGNKQARGTVQYSIHHKISFVKINHS